MTIIAGRWVSLENSLQMAQTKWRVQDRLNTKEVNTESFIYIFKPSQVDRVEPHKHTTCKHTLTCEHVNGGMSVQEKENKLYLSINNTGFEIIKKTFKKI